MVSDIRGARGEGHGDYVHHARGGKEVLRHFSDVCTALCRVM